MKLHLIACGLTIAATLAACGEKSQDAAQVVVEMHEIDSTGVGKIIGNITLTDTAAGLRLSPDLSDLPPGPHGFHIHENGLCVPGMKDGEAIAGLAAGGHFDPYDTGHHEGPEGAGHKGDLPVLMVNKNGRAKTVIVAPHLRVEEVKGRALMIHQNGDNYSDTPAPLGGGGARIACGVVPVGP